MDRPPGRLAGEEPDVSAAVQFALECAGIAAVVAAGVNIGFDVLRALVLALRGRVAPDLCIGCALYWAGVFGLLTFAAALGQA